MHDWMPDWNPRGPEGRKKLVAWINERLDAIVGWEFEAWFEAEQERAATDPERKEIVLKFLARLHEPTPEDRLRGALDEVKYGNIEPLRKLIRNLLLKEIGDRADPHMLQEVNRYVRLPAGRSEKAPDADPHELMVQMRRLLAKERRDDLISALNDPLLGEEIPEHLKVKAAHADYKRICSIKQQHTRRKFGAFAGTSAEEMAAERWGVTPGEARRGHVKRKPK
jgi:hypothetical protein